MHDGEITIKTTKTIRGLFMAPLEPGTYKAGCNRHGAVYAILEGGNNLGVKPGEFEFIEAPEWLLKKWQEIEGGKQ